MNKTALALALTALIAGALILTETNKTSAFEEWKQKYSPHGWTSMEENYRRIIFENNVKIIEKHNSDPYMTYKMGINQFTVYTDQ